MSASGKTLSATVHAGNGMYFHDDFEIGPDADTSPLGLAKAAWLSVRGKIWTGVGFEPADAAKVEILTPSEGSRRGQVHEFLVAELA